MHQAAFRGHGAVAQLLLNKPGIAVNATNDRGRTALHEAARRGHGAVVELLLNNLEIDPDARDLEGTTAIMLLLQKNFTNNALTECLRILVGSHRVDLELKNAEGLGLEDLAR